MSKMGGGSAKVHGLMNCSLLPTICWKSNILEKCLNPLQESVHTGLIFYQYIFHKVYNVGVTPSREKEFTSTGLDVLVMFLHMHVYIDSGFECLITLGARSRNYRLSGCWQRQGVWRSPLPSLREGLKNNDFVTTVQFHTWPSPSCDRLRWFFCGNFFTKLLLWIITLHGIGARVSPFKLNVKGPFKYLVILFWPSVEPPTPPPGLTWYF